MVVSSIVSNIMLLSQRLVQLLLLCGRHMRQASIGLHSYGSHDDNNRLRLYNDSHASRFVTPFHKQASIARNWMSFLVNHQTSPSKSRQAIVTGGTAVATTANSAHVHLNLLAIILETVIFNGVLAIILLAIGIAVLLGIDGLLFITGSS